MLDLADRQLGELSLFAMLIGMYREQRIGDVFQQSGMRWAQLSSRLGEEFKRHGAFDVRYRCGFGAYCTRRFTFRSA
jgi:hypothetical protein